LNKYCGKNDVGRRSSDDDREKDGGNKEKIEV
jgi:hypothetical protein